MSPSDFFSSGSRAGNFSVSYLGYPETIGVWDYIYVRPVINLNANIEITDITQDGTINNPYTIKM